MKSFDELNLCSPLQRALEDAGYQTPTPIQAASIPPLLSGRDVLGCAQTGTGKTAAFSLPILEHLAADAEVSGRHREIRALILTPTRELAAQIGDNFELYAKYLRIRHKVIFGGVSEKPQIHALKNGVDILIATPGRLLDLESRGYIDLSFVDFFVLDEADRMLDMGFVHDVKKVLRKLPKLRQNLLFSATMPKAITSLASTFLDEPVQIEVTPQSTTVERIEQTVMFVEKADKKRLLVKLIREHAVQRAIVFSRTKYGANRLAKILERAGISALAIHGNKSQNARTRAIESFSGGETRVLVATDIASRGIDIDEVSHVFNYELPNEPESYVHRIGRTGRAGREGVAISFCEESEGGYLRQIEKTIGQTIPPVVDHEFHCEDAIPPEHAPKPKGNRSRQRRRPSSHSKGRSDRSRRARSTTSNERSSTTPKPRSERLELSRNNDSETQQSRARRRRNKTNPSSTRATDSGRDEKRRATKSANSEQEPQIKNRSRSRVEKREDNGTKERAAVPRRHRRRRKPSVSE